MKSINTQVALRHKASHPAGGAWIEVTQIGSESSKTASHPAGGAWIEVRVVPPAVHIQRVAPRRGCVD